MQHAERLCERIILVARGEKIFDGTIAEAKRKIPRRVTLETVNGVGPNSGPNGGPNALELLGSLPEVVSIAASPPPLAEPGSNRWDVRVRDDADPSAILRACFERGISLRGFHQNDPTLHDVFVHLVGHDAREASFR